MPGTEPERVFRHSSLPIVPSSYGMPSRPANSPGMTAETDGEPGRPTDRELERTYDLVVRHGRVVNPETGLDRIGLNVAVQDGRIALVTDRELKGRRIIDATGLVVSPGFIDNLSYDPNPLGVWSKIADGVTTNLAMHGGTVDPNRWLAYYAGTRPTVERPERMSAGIRYVLVNGRILLDPGGLRRDERPGRPIRSEFVRYAGRAATVAVGDVRAPVASYRGAEYADADVLAGLGYAVRPGARPHAYELRVGGGGILGADGAAGAAPESRGRATELRESATELPEPARGEPMLERGDRLEWAGGSAELLAVGERLYVPLRVLEALGCALTRGGDGQWIANAGESGRRMEPGPLNGKLALPAYSRRLP